MACFTGTFLDDKKEWVKWLKRQGIKGDAAIRGIVIDARANNIVTIQVDYQADAKRFPKYPPPNVLVIEETGKEGGGASDEPQGHA